MDNILRQVMYLYHNKHVPLTLSLCDILYELNLFSSGGSRGYWEGATNQKFTSGFSQNYAAIFLELFASIDDNFDSVAILSD